MLVARQLLLAVFGAGSPALAGATCDPYAANCSSAGMPCPWPLPQSLCRAPTGATLLLSANVTVACDATCSPSTCATTTAKAAILRYQGLLRRAANSSGAAAFRSHHRGNLQQELSTVTVCAHEHSDTLPSTQDYSLNVAASGAATLQVGTIFVSTDLHLIRTTQLASRGLADTCVVRVASPGSSPSFSSSTSHPVSFAVLLSPLKTGPDSPTARCWWIHPATSSRSASWRGLLTAWRSVVLQITASLYILKVRMTILLVTLSVAVRRSVALHINL